MFEKHMNSEHEKLSDSPRNINQFRSAPL